VWPVNKSTLESISILYTDLTKWLAMPRTRRWKRRARSAPPAVLRKPNRPSRCKQWTEQQMLSATALAQSGEVSANHAADVHTHVQYCHNLSQVVLGYPGIMIPGTILGCPMPEGSMDPGILNIPGFLG